MFYKPNFLLEMMNFMFRLKYSISRVGWEGFTSVLTEKFRLSWGSRLDGSSMDVSGANSDDHVETESSCRRTRR